MFKIKSTKCYGCGAFAIQDISPGTLLMREKPFLGNNNH